MHPLCDVVASVMLLVWTLAPATGAGEIEQTRNWPGWRGPRHDGHASGARVPLTWSAIENVKWQVDLPGLGHSSPVVWDKKIFLTAATASGSERWVVCVERDCGKILWQRTAARDLPGEPVHAWNTHASSTCATDGQHVYAFFGTPGLFCYDLDGNLLWKKEFGPLVATTGWGGGAASPFLFEDIVFVNGDHGGYRGQKDDKGIDRGPSWLWALNKRSGELIWKTNRNQGMGWCTPLIWSHDGAYELVLNGQLGIWSYEPRTGHELWHVEGRAEGEGFGEVSPVWGRGLLFVFTGKPGPAWAIRPGGRGDVSKSHVVWQQQRKERDVSSPVLVDGRLYTVSRIGVVTCLDAGSGKEIWRERIGGEPCASLLSVGRNLLILRDDGTTFVVEPGPAFRLLHTNKLGSGDVFRASPAVVDRQLLVRSDRRLYSIEAAPRD